MERDTVIFDLIAKEKQRQLLGIELIASENFVSEQVMEAQGSVLTNKYAEGYPQKRYYGGCQVVDQVEQLAIDRAKALFGASYVNVQPHSGSQANAAVYFSVLKPRDKILGFDLAHGGHLTHGSPVNFSGKMYQAVFYGVDPETELLDYERIAAIAQKERPHIIVAGASSYARDIDFKKFRAIAESVGAYLLADIAHPAGMIAAGLLSDPMPHCHFVTTTTHKTLRGPRGGLIMMGTDFENKMGLKLKNGNLKKMSSILNGSVFPGMQGGPLEHVIAAKAIAFGEALTDEFKTYQRQVKANANTLAQALIAKDYKIVSGGTDNHCMLIDLRNKNISGKDAELALVKADITANKNMVPFDDKSPFVTSGIRLGTAAVTTRGLKETDMQRIADFIDEVIENHEDDQVLSSVASRVNEWMFEKPLFQ